MAASIISAMCTHTHVQVQILEYCLGRLENNYRTTNPILTVNSNPAPLSHTHTLTHTGNTNAHSQDCIRSVEHQRARKYIVSRAHLVCKARESNTVLQGVQLSGLLIQLTQTSVRCCIFSTVVEAGSTCMIIGARCFRTPETSRKPLKSFKSQGSLA